MSNLSDAKPVACGGYVLRRTDSHIKGNNKISVTNSGDRHIAPPIRNFALTTTPDSDERWGKTPCDVPIITNSWLDSDIWIDLDIWED